MPASAVASWDLKWGKKKAGWKQGYMGPQPFLCVPHMKKGCLIKRSRGSRQAGRPEGFVPLYVCEFLRKKDRFAAGCTTEQIYWKHRKCVLSINDGKRKERHVVRLTFIQRFTLLTIQVVGLVFFFLQSWYQSQMSSTSTKNLFNATSNWIQRHFYTSLWRKAQNKFLCRLQGSSSQTQNDPRQINTEVFKVKCCIHIYIYFFLFFLFIFFTRIPIT